VVAAAARARATAAVDLAAVAANVRRLCELAAPAELWAVVKADGYGHGAAAVGRAALAAGATRLCVAAWDEARALRDALPDAPVLVMGPLTPGEEEDVRDVDVAVSAAAGYARLRAAASAPLGVHVKVETGMGRWGMTEDEALAVAADLADGGPLRLAGLMSHLATADTDAAFARAQVARFAAFADRFPACPRHLANSPATLSNELRGRARFDAVRCGVAVYGLSPFGGDPAHDGLAPALRFETYVADVKLLAPGESAGYGRRFVAREPTWIGLAPAGYADGVPRILSGRADVLVGGRRRRVAATIRMDQLTFVVGPERDVEPGDPVTLIGEDGGERVTAEEWASLAGTINYEITTGIAPRPRRVRRAFAGA
jgi:alanine racemase